MDESHTLRVVIGPAPPGRLDKALARDVLDDAALSRTRIAGLIAEGAVSRDGVVIADPKARVAEGDVIAIAVPPAAPSEVAPQPIPLTILYEDDALIVVDKPAGMVVHPAPGAPDGTLVNALLHHCGDSLAGIGGTARPGIVHRIDKDTSGILVAAKTDAAHHHLSGQFADHSADRRYLALVHGAPEAGDPRLVGRAGVSTGAGGWLRIATQIGRHRTDRQRQAVLTSGGRAAVTHAHVIDRYGSPGAAALVECRLETGRTHQIRVHLAHIGHGLIGDPVYGGRRRPSSRALDSAALAAVAAFPRQALHAADLGFVHPVTRLFMAFSSQLPQDMLYLKTLLGAKPPQSDAPGGSA